MLGVRSSRNSHYASRSHEKGKAISDFCAVGRCSSQIRCSWWGTNKERVQHFFTLLPWQHVWRLRLPARQLGTEEIAHWSECLWRTEAATCRLETFCSLFWGTNHLYDSYLALNDKHWNATNESSQWPLLLSSLNVIRSDKRVTKCRFDHSEISMLRVMCTIA